MASTLIYFIIITETNSSVNPSHGFGQSLFVGDWALARLWMFILIPMFEAVAAGTVSKKLVKNNLHIALLPFLNCFK